MDSIKKLISKIVESIFDNEFIYHGTSKGAAMSIQRDGYMKSGNTGEQKPSISFTKNFNYAKHFAQSKGGKDKMIILRTPLSDKFILSPRISNNVDYEYVTFNPIWTNDLEVLSKDGNWKPLETWNVIFDEPL